MNKKLKNYPFWSICIALCFGVFLGRIFNFPLLFLGSFFFTLILLILLFNKSKPLLFTAISCFAFMSLGAIRYQISTPENQKNHICNYPLSNSNNEIIFKVNDVFKASKKYLNYKIQLQKINDSIIKGYAILSLEKDSLKTLKRGHTYAGLLKLKKLKPSGNPYIFEYSNYLKNNHITHQTWSKPNEIFHIKSTKNALDHLRFSLQKHLQKQLKIANLSKDVKDFTNALVLGNKNGLSTDLKDSFIDAGVIHILAISGLHIGILFFILNAIFQFFFPKQKNKIYNALFVVSILWLYTWFIGSSASAIRATTMFTCFQFSRLLLRDQHPINALFLSVFILILHNPYILFSVGFQLSVVAVASIILGMPICLHLWFPKNWFIHKLWTIASVSICAQIGILPLSIFYFHQFSGVFLVANIPIMIIIPVILSVSLVIVVLLGVNYMPQFLFSLYNESILIIFKYVEWIASFEKFIFQNLYINTFTFLCFYIIIGCITYLMYQPKKRIYLWLVPVISFFTCCFFEIYTTLNKNELWMLSTYKNLIFTELTSNKINIHSSKPINTTEKHYVIDPVKQQLHYKKTIFNDLKTSYHYYGKEIFILRNKEDIEHISHSSTIVLHESPKINLERLIKNQQPKQIIASNYNYPSFVKKWKSTCNALQVDFYSISEKGALCISN